MTKLINLLYIIARALEGMAERWEQRRRQNERDELEANPGEWFKTTFSGKMNSSINKGEKNGKKN